MKLINKTKQIPLVSNVVIADTFLSRMVGLLNRKQLNFDEALIITKCNSIHMFFMRFAIDVVFVNNDYQVVGLVKNIKPFCLSKIYFNACSAIELQSGKIIASKIEIGDTLKLQE